MSLSSVGKKYRQFNVRSTSFRFPTLYTHSIRSRVVNVEVDLLRNNSNLFFSRNLSSTVNKVEKRTVNNFNSQDSIRERFGYATRDYSRRRKKKGEEDLDPNPFEFNKDKEEQKGQALPPDYEPPEQKLKGLQGPFYGIHKYGSDWWNNFIETRDMSNAEYKKRINQEFDLDRVSGQQAVDSMKIHEKFNIAYKCSSLKSLFFAITSDQIWRHINWEVRDRLPEDVKALVGLSGYKYKYRYYYYYNKELLKVIFTDGWCQFWVLFIQIFGLSTFCWFIYSHFDVMEIFPGYISTQLFSRCGSLQTYPSNYGHRYHDEHVLREMIYNLPEHTLLTIIGPPKSGKTTLLQHCIDTKIFLNCRVNVGEVDFSEDSNSQLISQFTKNSKRRKLLYYLYLLNHKISNTLGLTNQKEELDLEIAYLERILTKKLNRKLFLDYWNLGLGTILTSFRIHSPRTRLIYIENADSLAQKN